MFGDKDLSSVNLFIKTDDFIKISKLLSKPDDFTKTINLFGKTDDIIRNDECI